MAHRPLIVDVKRDSSEDGPGIRSVVFFKGCPLRCLFCHNPETQSPRQEIAFSSLACIDCRECEKVCPAAAIDPELPGRIVREKCDRCGICADRCPASALRRIGLFYPVQELTELLLRDEPFYRHSGGGVTLSGGECTMFPAYARRLLERLKDHGIHIVLQTCGYFNYRTFRRMILPYVDMIYFDLKLIDDEAHRRYTGRPNRIILRNLRDLIRDESVPITPRIPLVPGITVAPENLSSIADFLRECGAQRVSLLPYNPLGLAKYEHIGRTAPSLPETFMREEDIKDAFEALGQLTKRELHPRH
jgi:pyruvate formate lyase activating enzyme